MQVNLDEEKTHRSFILHTKLQPASSSPGARPAAEQPCWRSSSQAHRLALQRTAGTAPQHGQSLSHFGASSGMAARHRNQAWEIICRRLSVHQRAGLGCSLVLTTLCCLLETALALRTPASHQRWGGKPGRVVLLLQRLTKLPVDVSHNERACAGHPHRSYGRVSSSALPEQLTGWENLNPPAATPAAYGQTQGRCFYSPARPDRVSVQ